MHLLVRKQKRLVTLGFSKLYTLMGASYILLWQVSSYFLKIKGLHLQFLAKKML